MLTRSTVRLPRVRRRPVRPGEVTVTGAAPAGEQTLTVDTIVAATGFRPDLDMLREVRLELDTATEGPVKLAPMIDPNFHSCGSVPPHGERELAHPETGFYLAGMTSYGRAPTFLLATGYEQVRSIAAALAGDREAADRVQLDLPETGVCSTNLPTEGEAGDCTASCGGEPVEAAAACCGEATEPVPLGFATGRVHGYSGEAGHGDG